MWVELISRLSNVIIACSSLAIAIFGYRALHAWKKEFPEKKKVDLVNLCILKAEKFKVLLNSSYRLSFDDFYSCLSEGEPDLKLKEIEDKFSSYFDESIEELLTLQKQLENTYLEFISLHHYQIADLRAIEKSY